MILRVVLSDGFYDFRDYIVILTDDIMILRVVVYDGFNDFRDYIVILIDDIMILRVILLMSSLIKDVQGCSNLLLIKFDHPFQIKQ
jgi:hypothetical protein